MYFKIVQIIFILNLFYIFLNSKKRIDNIIPKIFIMSSLPKVIFVLGGPGAGKGTQCTKIVEVRKYLK